MSGHKAMPSHKGLPAKLIFLLNKVKSSTRSSILNPSRNNLGLSPLVARGINDDMTDSSSLSELSCCIRPLRSRSCQQGFTLLESLVALAILAIALAAVLRATGAGTNHVADLRQRLLADWVAQNRIALHAARGDWLPVGSQQGEETQAGIKFLWDEKISDTPNRAFRRIEVSIASAEDPQHVLRQLSGYLIQFPRR